MGACQTRRYGVKNGEGSKKETVPEITKYPEWVPDVDETIQIVFINNEFEFEEGYEHKTVIMNIETTVDRRHEHAQENGQLTYFLTVSLDGRSCQIKLSKNGASSFDNTQMNHGNLSFPSEFYVLRFSSNHRKKNLKNRGFDCGGPPFRNHLV